MKKLFHIITYIFTKPQATPFKAVPTEFNLPSKTPDRKKDNKEFSLPLWLKLPNGEIIKGYGFFGRMESCTWCNEEGYAPYNISGWNYR